MVNENPGIPAVIPYVVEKGLCIGCGMCAATCPGKNLAMAWNRSGEYNPVVVAPCTTECGTCLKVCPFAPGGENEDAIGERLFGTVPGMLHCPETGYYLASCAGYSEIHRSAGASGGIATWLLEALLTGGVVDRVACVAPTGEPERLFAFSVFDTPEAVRTGAGSAYYPVEMSTVIRYILETPGRYAITGLPCFIKAVRLGQLRNPVLRERIIVTIGLVCGQMKGRHYTDYAAALAGVRGTVKEVRCRVKSPDQPASNFQYLFRTDGGGEARIFWNRGVSEAWVNRWFTPRACNYCDDIFAECADATCMDAWLPEYTGDSRGWSLLLVRSPRVQDLVDRRQGAFLKPAGIRSVIRSQAGVIQVKRIHLAHRLYLDREKGSDRLQKRVAPERSKDAYQREEIQQKDLMQGLSRECWAARPGDSGSLRQAMLPHLERIRKRREHLLGVPIRKIRGIMKGLYHE